MDIYTVKMDAYKLTNKFVRSLSPLTKFLLLVGLFSCCLLIVSFQIVKKEQDISAAQFVAQKNIVPVDPDKLNPGFNIIINAVPKSASAYIVKTLEQSLQYTHFQISSEYIPHDQLIYFRLEEFYSNGSLSSKQHFDASPLNLRVLKRFTNKMVLNLRDPREILLSWVHHLNELKAEGIDIYYIDPLPPPGYYKLSLKDQIDWNIENFLPFMITWMNDWLATKEQEDADPNGLKILVTTYDELKRDELALYKKIITFYDIRLDRLNFSPAEKDRKVHYRKGDSDEWRQVFTDQQKRRISEIVPDNLLNRFNWNK